MSGEPGNRLHTGGTYICMEGPAFSTRAESNFYRSLDASVIGMTALPEAKLAREAEICYVMIAMSTDYDCWKVEEQEVTVEMIIAHMQKNTQRIKEALPAIIPAILSHTDCSHHSAAQFAVITAKEKISSAAKKDLKLLYGKYF